MNRIAAHFGSATGSKYGASAISISIDPPPASSPVADTTLIDFDDATIRVGLETPRCALGVDWQDGEMVPASYLDRLRAELDYIESALRTIIRESKIRYVNPNRPGDNGIVVGAADWGWGPSDPPHLAARMQLLERYRNWFGRLNLLFPHPTPEVENTLTGTSEFVHAWLLRPDTWDHTIPATPDEAERVAEQQLTQFRNLLDVAAFTGTNEPRLVPDTNALLRNPDLASYEAVTNTPRFTIHLVPAVLNELDDLKDRGRTEDVREKARSVVRRIKGLRDRGNLREGVKLAGSISVQLEHREPDTGLLEWLDPSVPDDRLLASALQLQSGHPSGVVVVVTSDINLQTKAEAAGLPYAETPPTVASRQANLTADLISSKGKVSAVVLRNEGPATAREITYSINTPKDLAPPHIRCGPWTQERLAAGEAADPQPVVMIAAPVELNVTWVDDTGERSTTTVLQGPTGRRPR